METPNKVPPMTSVVQCSPNDIREYSITPTRIVMDPIRIIFSNGCIFLDCKIKKIRSIPKKTERIECPDG